jgi:hypothetical protein
MDALTRVSANTEISQPTAQNDDAGQAEAVGGKIGGGTICPSDKRPTEKI